ncbi:MAG: trypsin-like peptidase domain-containing protein [Syntrophomonadaceae bacterium]
MTRKVMGFLLAMAILAAFPGSAAAIPKVLINGYSLNLDVPPQIQNGRVMVPISPVFKSLGGEVTWVGETQTILGKRYLTRIALQVGKTSAILNGVELTLDSPPVIIDGRTLIPVSLIARALGAEVMWDAPSETVSVVVSDTDGLPTNTQIMECLGPTVVELTTMDKSGAAYAYGSGVIVSSDGKIVTNYHVLEGATQVEVNLENGKTYTCKEMLGYDVDRDIAVLKIEASGLPKAELGDSDKVITGNNILTIGCPQGLERTMSDGLVSSIRTFEEQKYIQISAPIDHGSSGGALIDNTGQVIGITCATIEYAQNLNFAIPINDVKDIIKVETFSPFTSVFTDRY